MPPLSAFGFAFRSAVARGGAAVRRGFRVAGRFLRLERGRRALLVEAAVWLVVARITLMVLPFSRIAPRLGRSLAPEQGRRYGFPEPPSPRSSAIAREVGWAVTRAARHLPFRAVCLPQAMAAKVMLRRRGVVSVLSFGVAPARVMQGESHAWLTAAGVEVTGYPTAAAFTEVVCYV